MNLLEVDHPAFDVEPDSGVALSGWLVLPAIMRRSVTHDGRELALERQLYV